MNIQNNFCFLYPSGVIKIKQVDEQYAEEAEYMRQYGFVTALISLEELNSGIKHFSSPISNGSLVIYRGWMLTAENYDDLISTIKKSNLCPFTSAESYLLAHHLPNWYPFLKNFTAETAIFNLKDDLKIALNKLGWKNYFIKDYVKSLKTSIGSLIESAADINIVISEMQKYRGTIEGGICVRQVECYKPNSEKRFFVINNKPFCTNPDEKIPSIVFECANRINSPFFSVDVAELNDGQLRIVEIGDGQVSDLVGWSVKRFIQIWTEIRG